MRKGDEERGREGGRRRGDVVKREGGTMRGDEEKGRERGRRKKGVRERWGGEMRKEGGTKGRGEKKRKQRRESSRLKADVVKQ